MASTALASARQPPAASGQAGGGRAGADAWIGPAAGAIAAGGEVVVARQPVRAAVARSGAGRRAPRGMRPLSTMS
jgi:hypothetical protein